MADLPPEVITEILSWLPVKSLLCFRCTCKWWCSLIDSSYFIFLHLNKSHESNIILQHKSRFYQLHSNTVNGVKELNHPLISYRNRINILGSCNGVLCISNIVHDIAFWNPTIRKHRFLPSEPLNHIDEDDNISIFAKVYGFGYDSFSNDFKLVSISLFLNLNNISFDSQVNLYSLRTNAWKNLPSMPYALIRVTTMGVFVNGALHWLASRKQYPPATSDLILAFDLRFESYREVQLPVTVTVTVNRKSEMNLALLKECLCMIENRSEGFDVWVMKEYGIRDSWCKLFSVEQQQHVVKCLKPVGYSRDGDKILLEMYRSGKLCWYNLASRDIINVTISGMSKSFEGIVCVGSLVTPTLLSSSVYNNKKNHKFEDKKKRDDFLSEGFKLKL